MRHGLLPILTTTALVLAGCTGGVDEVDDADPSPTTGPTATTSPSPEPSPTATAQPSPSPSPTGELAGLDFTDCESDDVTVPYPASWEVNDESGPLEGCRIFHPDEVDVPEQPQDIGLHWAATVGIEQAAFEDVVGADVQGEVLARREATVAGRDAIVLEYRSDGSGLVPEDERRYGWAVELDDGATLVASTYSVGETDYERDKAVLDRMMEGLELRTLEPVAGPEVESSSRDAAGSELVVTDVRLGAHQGFDRIVLQLAGEGEVGWDIAYTDDPREQGSGRQVEVEGDATLRVDVVGVALPPEASEEYWDGGPLDPERTAVVREVTESGIFEGRARFFLGLEDQRPFRVERLTDPQRIVIDVPTG